MDEWYVSFGEQGYLLINQKQGLVSPLAAGSCFQLWIGGEWCSVEMVRGECNGWYYKRADGVSERLALSMLARLGGSELLGIRGENE